jgi:hypothetical protein
VWFFLSRSFVTFWVLSRFSPLPLLSFWRIWWLRWLFLWPRRLILCWLLSMLPCLWYWNERLFRRLDRLCCQCCLLSSTYIRCLLPGCRLGEYNILLLYRPLSSLCHLGAMSRSFLWFDYDGLKWVKVVFVLG